MPDDLQCIIAKVVSRAPEWVRHDLTSSESAVRLRAEETLAAMIEQAIRHSPDA
jgi:hypothetical protein